MSDRSFDDHARGPGPAAMLFGEAHGDGMGIREIPGMGHINIRGNANDTKFLAAMASILGQSLPVIANTMTLGAQRIYWLGPDEWLLVTPDDSNDELLDRMREQQLCVTDMSGGNIILQLTGAYVSNLIAKACTLDLHADTFQPGQCAQSGLAKANVLIGFIDSNPTYEIIVRRSFSDYMKLWLLISN